MKRMWIAPLTGPAVVALLAIAAAAAVSHARPPTRRRRRSRSPARPARWRPAKRSC